MPRSVAVEPVGRSPIVARRRLALGLALGWLASAPAAAEPPSLAERVVRLEAESPALLEAEALDSDSSLLDFDDARFDALLVELRRGIWNARIENALRVIFWVFPEQSGPLATEGRMLLDRVVGAASESGSGPVVRRLEARSWTAYGLARPKSPGELSLWGLSDLEHPLVRPVRPPIRFLKMAAKREAIDLSQIGQDDDIAAIFGAGREALKFVATRVSAYDFFRGVRRVRETAHKE